MRGPVRSVALLLALACGGATAGMMSDRERDELIALVLKNFWGKAKLANGQAVQPASPEERNTAPIPKPVAQRAIDAGEISGLGQWCELDWQAHYLSLTKAARERGLSDTQVAFVSVLHGAAQGRVAQAMSRGRHCSDAERAKIERYLEDSRQQGLDGT